MGRNLFTFLTVLTLAALASGGDVVELTDSFWNGPTDVPWLIMFYAPWCGYCKQMAPVYELTAKRLRPSGVHVGRIDGTRWTEGTAKYQIRGFPTIKFFLFSEVLDYDGDRTANALTQFALRASAPPVRHVPDGGKIRESLPAHLPDSIVIFVYAGDQGHPMMHAYSRLASRMRLDAFFLSANQLPAEIPSHQTETGRPTVVAMKDNGKIKLFQAPSNVAEDELSSRLDEWMEREKWPVLMEFGGSSLDKLSSGRRFAILAVLEKPSAGQVEPEINKRLKTLLRKMTENPSFDDDQGTKEGVRFGFTHDLVLVASLTVGYVTPPAVVALQPNTSLYAAAPFPPDFRVDSAKTSDANLEKILDAFVLRVVHGREPLSGGRGVLMTFRRLLHEISSTIVAVWLESPVLACVVVGAPSLVVSFVVYALCCMEAIDDGPENPYGDSDEEQLIDDAIDAAQRFEAGDGLFPGFHPPEEVFERGPGGDGVRRRVPLDEDTTWEELLRDNVPVADTGKSEEKKT